MSAEWLPAYEADQRRLDADVRESLLAASRATLVRFAVRRAVDRQMKEIEARRRATTA